MSKIEENKKDTSKIVYRPISSVKTSIGDLSIFSLSIRNYQNILVEIRQPLSLCDPKIFVKYLIRYICYPNNKLNNEQERPETPILTLDDIESLSDIEIESIIGEYLEKETSLLYRSKILTDENGHYVSHKNIDEIEYPKEDGENNVEYVHRIYKLRAEEISKFHALQGEAHFSEKVLKKISNMALLSENIKNTIIGIHMPDLPKLDTFNPNISNFSNEMHSDNSLGLCESIDGAKWIPINYLGKKIDELICISSELAGFIVEMNETQTVIATEIKASSYSSTKLSKWNIFFTIIVIILTCFIAGANYIQSNENAIAIKNYSETISKTLLNINKSVSINQKNQNLALDRMLIELKGFHQESQGMLKNQNDIIIMMLQKFEIDQKNIKVLNEKIIELEKSLQIFNIQKSNEDEMVE